jgi:hypothetical protein
MTPEERKMMMDLERIQQMRAPNALLAASMTPEAQASQESFMAARGQAMQPSQAVGPAPGSRPPNPFVSGLSKLGRRAMDALQDPAVRSRLAAGLQSMTLNPNQAFIQSQMQRGQNIQARRQQAEQANMTAEYFRQQGQPEIASLIEKVPGIGTEALKSLFREPAKAPSILQEYMFARSQNPELTYQQFLQMKESGTTVNIPAPDVAGEAAMKQLPVAFKEVTDAGANARAQLNSIGQLSRALSGVETGGFAETKKNLLGLADRLGVQVNTEELGRLQAVDAIASQLVAAELRQNKGPQTDFDARFTQTFLPGLGQQKSANDAIISYMNSRNLRDALIGSYASTNRSFDATDVDVMRNVNIMRQTVGSVIYKGDEPVTLEEFVTANRAAGKSDSEILMDWYAEHDPRGAAAMRGAQ